MPAGETIANMNETTPQNPPYEPPAVSDLDTEDGPSTVAAGTVPITPVGR